MKQVKDYSKSPAPCFDALEDIKFYLGAGFSKISQHIGTIKDPEQFEIACSFVGIEGRFPVMAWYDHINGGGSFDKAWAAKEAGAGHDPR